MNRVEEAKLREMNVVDLRNFARDIGIVASTTYKKQDLIDKIMLILNGQIQPEMPTSKKGRPPKNKGNIEQKLVDNNFNEALDNNLQSSNNNLIDNSLLINKTPWSLYDASSNLDKYNGIFDYKTDCGYIKLVGDKSYIIPLNNLDPDFAITIPSEMIKTHHLKSADIVDFEYKNSKNYNLKVITKITQKEFFSDNRLDFEQIKRNQQKDKIDLPILKKYNIFSGDRVVLRTNNLHMYIDFVVNLDRQDLYEIVNLYLDELPEEELSIKENFSTTIGESVRKNILTIDLCLSRVKRLVEQGKKVILCVNELMKIIKYQNFQLGFEIRDIKSNSLAYISKLFKLAGNYDNGASVTILALYKIDNLTSCGNLLLSEIENFNSKIVDF